MRPLFHWPLKPWALRTIVRDSNLHLEVTRTIVREKVDQLNRGNASCFLEVLFTKNLLRFKESFCVKCG